MSKATFPHGNREVTATITGTEAWEKAGMSRVYINLAFTGAKLAPIDKLYEVLAGGTKDATVEVHGRTFGYQLGLSCDSKTKRAAAIEAITQLLTEYFAPAPAATTTTKEAFHDHIRTTERLHNSGCIVEYNEATGNTNWIVAGNIFGQSKGRIGQSTDYVIVDTPLAHHIAAEELHCKTATEVGEQHPAYGHHTTLSSLHCRAAGALKSASMATTNEDRAVHLARHAEFQRRILDVEALI